MMMIEKSVKFTPLLRANIHVNINLDININVNVNTNNLEMNNMTVLLSQMKKRSKMVGQDWFSKGNMEYFGTKIVVVPNYMNVFVTSEFDFYRDENNRRFTIRWFDEKTCKVETIGEFQAFVSIEEAKEKMAEVTKEMEELEYAM